MPGRLPPQRRRQNVLRTWVTFCSGRSRVLQLDTWYNTRCLFFYVCIEREISPTPKRKTDAAHYNKSVSRIRTLACAGIIVEASFHIWDTLVRA